MGLSSLQLRGPHSLSAATYDLVSSFPRAIDGPKAAAAEDEGVGLPGELVRAQHAAILLPDFRHTAHGSLILRPCPA